MTTERALLSDRQYYRQNSQKLQVQSKKISEDKIVELQKEAALRVAISSSCECNPIYKTLFFGLKKNHPKNLALVYPMIYLLRRILFTLLILFGSELPFMSVVIMMLGCVAMLALVHSEQPWDETIINYQHIVNEVVFYLILLIVLVFCGLNPTSVSGSFLGWSLIAILFMTLTFNIIIICYLTIRRMKLIVLRWNNRYRARQIVAINNQTKAETKKLQHMKPKSSH